MITEVVQQTLLELQINSTEQLNQVIASGSCLNIAEPFQTTNSIADTNQMGYTDYMD